MDYDHLDWDAMHELGFNKFANYVQFCHEWTQVCGQLHPNGKNGKAMQQEAEMYDRWMWDNHGGNTGGKRYPCQ